MSLRKTTAFTTCRRSVPADFSTASTFRIHCRTCSSKSPSRIFFVSGSIGTWPETKTRFPVTIPGEYGDWLEGDPGQTARLSILFAPCLVGLRLYATQPGMVNARSFGQPQKLKQA